MKKHETALTDGQMANFVGEGTKAITLIANKLGPDLADNWARNGNAMQKAFLEALTPPEELETNSILRLLSDEPLALDPCDGKETLAQANDVFSSIDGDFKNWGTDKAGEPAPGLMVNVHEISQDATFVKMFGSLSSDTRKLCIPQGQIKQFVTKHRKWLCVGGNETFFLFEVDGKFFVAFVGVFVDGTLRVHLDDFGYDIVWFAKYRHRVVVPQLKLGN